jgi:hypothetical protein
MSAYHRYLCARGYASGYRWTRVAIARDWLRFTGGRLEVDHRDVERWLVGRDVSAGTGRN